MTGKRLSARLCQHDRYCEISSRITELVAKRNVSSEGELISQERRELAGNAGQFSKYAKESSDVSLAIAQAGGKIIIEQNEKATSFAPGGLLGGKLPQAHCP